VPCAIAVFVGLFGSRGTLKPANVCHAARQPAPLDVSSRLKGGGVILTANVEHHSS